MPALQRRRPKEIRPKFCGSFASIILRVSLLNLVLFNLQTFGVEQIDFCFDKPKTGQRLNTTVINFTRASTGLECIIRCATEDKSCRSVNFRNQIEDEKNCEFLQNVSSEERADLLLPDEHYDYYTLLRHSTTAPEQVSSSTPPPANSTESSSTNPSSTPPPNKTESPSTMAPPTSSVVHRKVYEWLRCEGDNHFMTGFYQSNTKVARIEAICCGPIPEFSDQHGHATKADTHDRWIICPAGYFLKNVPGYQIYSGDCCKPSTHPNDYGLCYDKDVGKGWTNCSNGYYITGVHSRGENINKFRCCQMASENQALELLPSCNELLKKNSSLSDGVYTLRNTNVSPEEYQVYCHMTEIPGCVSGGWTLVMKIDGHKNEFNYRSRYWTNKKTYAVQDGLEGLTEKQTKLASYWNTPFKKICLGMKVNDDTKWIMIKRQASSLFNVIADGRTKYANVRKEKWSSLIDGSLLEEDDNRERFNVNISQSTHKLRHLKVRIGITAWKNDDDKCFKNRWCRSCIGFGISARGCDGEIRNTTCGNIAICCLHENQNTPAFGYIFVQ